MVVQFILDSGELSIFVEFRDSANVAKYWKYMKDKVSYYKIEMGNSSYIFAIPTYSKSILSLIPYIYIHCLQLANGSRVCFHMRLQHSPTRF